MSNIIHSTAIVDKNAILGDGNYIGPFCWIGSNVQIGKNNDITGYSSIGMAAEHRDYFHKEGRVVIGDNNIIREFTTINASTFGITKMGNNCVMLRGSHLSHDSILEDDVNVSCNALIGGESTIMRGSNLGLGCIIHQRQAIGSWTMIGMGAVITKSFDCIPGNVYVGNPAKFLKQNLIGLSRSRVSKDRLDEEILRWMGLRKL